ncbi:hypothetical protein FG379_002733 [Cryptosporidium bovis]|uniref:uncharacterized protein n=1 Tax=Cryptosporidium bovis TaxID=310047 RepID=UPI00351A8B03|nr:hypothetical protein FG379_002733 [Cryptosporidium bovis]
MESFSRNSNSFKTLDEMFYSSKSSSSVVNKDDKFHNFGLLSADTYKKNNEGNYSVGKNIKNKRSDECGDNNKDKNSSESSKRSKITKNTNLLSFDFEQQTETDTKNETAEQKNKKNDYTTEKEDINESKIEINVQKVDKKRNISLTFNSIGKDKTVDTSFLPDKRREIEEQIMIEKLKKEEIEQEERLKNQIIEVVFSYWDGRGHRRSIKIQRDATVGEFLEKCRIKLKSEFKEFSRISSGSLMYIKEDVILPHSITFHELIKTKARGKTGIVTTLIQLISSATKRPTVSFQRI